MEGRWGEKTKEEESFVLNYLNTDIDFCIDASELWKNKWNQFTTGFLLPIFTCMLECLQVAVKMTLDLNCNKRPPNTVCCMQNLH
jgi:hypothetical protein